LTNLELPLGLPPPRVSRSFETDRIMAQQAAGETRDAQAVQDTHVLKIMQHVDFPTRTAPEDDSVPAPPAGPGEPSPDRGGVISPWTGPRNTSFARAQAAGERGAAPAHVQPELKCLEWSGVPLIQDPDPAEGRSAPPIATRWSCRSRSQVTSTNRGPAGDGQGDAGTGSCLAWTGGCTTPPAGSADSLGPS